jgi:hypothetical protein
MTCDVSIEIRQNLALPMDTAVYIWSCENILFDVTDLLAIDWLFARRVCILLQQSFGRELGLLRREFTPVVTT